MFGSVAETAFVMHVAISGGVDAAKIAEDKAKGDGAVVVGWLRGPSIRWASVAAIIHYRL